MIAAAEQLQPVQDFEGRARRCRPCRQPPRSAAKLAVLAGRARRGESLFHKDDPDLDEADVLVPDPESGSANGEHGGHIQGLLHRRADGSIREVAAGAPWSPDSRPTKRGRVNPTAEALRKRRYRAQATPEQRARIAAAKRDYKRRQRQGLGRMSSMSQSRTIPSWVVILPDGRRLAAKGHTACEARSDAKRQLGLTSKRSRLPVGTVCMLERERVSQRKQA